MCKIYRNLKFECKVSAILFCVIPVILIVSFFTPMAIDKIKINSYHFTTFTIINVTLSPSQGCKEVSSYYTDCFLCAETVYQAEWTIDNTRHTDNLVSCPAFDYTQFDINMEETLMRAKLINTSNKMCGYFAQHPEKCFLTDETASMKESVTAYFWFGIIFGVLPVIIFFIVLVFNTKDCQYSDSNKFRKSDSTKTASISVEPIELVTI